MELHFFIIRHIPSGWYLPDVPRGRTHVEPTKTLPPRLFTEARHAKGFLTLYCRGPMIIKDMIDTESGEWLRSYLDHDWSKPRRREDFCVVPVEIVEDVL